MRLRRVDRTTWQLDTELASITLRTPLSDTNFLHVETDLGIVKIRLNVHDDLGKLEAVEIQPNKNVEVTGDTMILLRPKGEKKNE